MNSNDRNKHIITPVKFNAYVITASLFFGIEKESTFFKANFLFFQMLYKEGKILQIMMQSNNYLSIP